MTHARAFPRLLPRKGTPQRLVLVGVAAASLLLVGPFFFWFFTWFGWALDPAQVSEALADPVRPAHATQMLLQMGEKVSRNDQTMRRYYPRILALAKHPDTDIRRSVAWFMGEDPADSSFHQALLSMLRDPAPMVRRRAALSLANFHDPAAREELTRMLAPFAVTAEAPGQVEFRIQPRDITKPFTVVARIAGAELLAGIPGAVSRHLAADGAAVQKGQAVIEIIPDPAHVREARRALTLLN
ncbi:MAG: HEAT repeat domain-containing protein [Bryobacterales bacterium]|nr:HEAT repeat domain-containing protein [Bryobacterales bacterium]